MHAPRKPLAAHVGRLVELELDYCATVLLGKGEDKFPFQPQLPGRAARPLPHRFSVLIQ